MQKINLKEKFDLFSDHWTPRIIGKSNGQDIKIAKVKGDFVWHNHEHEDELFYVIKGTLHIDFQDKTVTLNEGEMLVVPKGVEHKPFAKEEVWLMLIEPSTIKHTGEVKSDLTVDTCDEI